MTNNRKKEYRIERLDESKLNDVASLYKTVYGYRPGKKYLLKKYDTAYTGAQYIGYLAYDSKNSAVAFFSVIPCFIQLKEKIILSAQAVDAMTHPQHRYKELFIKVAAITFDLCKQTHIKLIFGFPNQNSYHGLVHKLGWKKIENMERFTIPVNMFSLESLSQRFKFTKWIYKKYANRILRKNLLMQPGLSNSAIAEGYGGVFRDEQYLQYKTYNETKVIKVGNAKVWIKIKNGFIIGDLDLAEHDFDLAMIEIKKIAKHLGISHIFFQASPNTQLHTLFARRYKSELSFPVILLDIDAGIALDKLKFSFADIDIF